MNVNAHIAVSRTDFAAKPRAASLRASLSQRRSRELRWRAWFVLALFCGGLLAAQDPNTPPPAGNATRAPAPPAQGPGEDPNGSSLTNELSDIEELLGMTEEPADENPADHELSSTNAPNGTNDLGEATEPAPRKSSGRESRSRRYSKQRSSPSGRASDGSFSGSSQAQSNTGPASLEYSAFRLVVERNIFDPNRRPPRGDRSSAPPPPRNRDPQYFTLVGTMSYEKGTFAFFTGTSHDYQKALTNTDTIAGFKLAAISPNSVKLARDNHQVELQVGMQMRLEDDGSWQPGRAPAQLAASNSGAGPTTGSSAQTASAASAAENEIIKRLMQKREQE